MFSRNVVTHFEKPLSFREAFLPTRSAPPEVPSLRSMALAAALVVYALGAVALCPVCQSAAARSAAEGNDPALLAFVGP